MLPFAEKGAARVRTVVWRSDSRRTAGRKPYRLEVSRRNMWRQVGHDRLTNDAGVFVRTRFASSAAHFSGSNRRASGGFSLQLRIR